MNPQHNLKAFCKSKGITNAQIADKLGVSQSAVNQFLNGRNSATMDTITRYLRAISDISGVSEYDMVGKVLYPGIYQDQSTPLTVGKAVEILETAYAAPKQ